jgi:hypothetical protein
MESLALFYFFRLDQGSQMDWTCMSMGEHHTVAVDGHSQVYAMGRYVLV